MRIGELLVKQGLATEQDIARATERQSTEGGRLGDNLIALGVVTAAQLDNLFHEAPREPRTIEETGISRPNLNRLLVKTMAVRALQTARELCDAMRLSYHVVTLLLEEANALKQVEILGTTGSGPVTEFRYSMTDKGREDAEAALALSQYTGPVPVPLAAYRAQIERQRITNERFDRAAVKDAFSDLVVPDFMIRQLGPAINAGRSILLYGPAGNGKTSIAERIGRLFRDAIYIPHAIEVESSIIKIYDPGMHIEVKTPKQEKSALLRNAELRREDLDHRWVACRRPLAITGGELTMEMLDLQFNEFALFYDAPMHVKAMNGIFLIDDFGRQLISPKALLNRWIVPLESRVDYLKLHTGKSFQLPFDELVIFSTNMHPDDLMDPAFLRRIPYKMEVLGPSKDVFVEIFNRVSVKHNLTLSQKVLDFVIDQIENANSKDLAAYQPRFIVEQILAACKFEGVPPVLKHEMVDDALKNLFVKSVLKPKDGSQNSLNMDGASGNGARQPN